jgi:hypothetical protein
MIRKLIWITNGDCLQASGSYAYQQSQQISAKNIPVKTAIYSEALEFSYATHKL